MRLPALSPRALRLARRRGGIDLEALTGDAVSVVRDALHPSHATVWLRPSEGER